MDRSRGGRPSAAPTALRGRRRGRRTVRTVPRRLGVRHLVPGNGAPRGRRLPRRAQTSSGRRQVSSCLVGRGAGRSRQRRHPALGPGGSTRRGLRVAVGGRTRLRLTLRGESPRGGPPSGRSTAPLSGFFGGRSTGRRTARSEATPRGWFGALLRSPEPDPRGGPRRQPGAERRGHSWPRRGAGPDETLGEYAALEPRCSCTFGCRCARATAPRGRGQAAAWCRAGAAHATDASRPVATPRPFGVASAPFGEPATGCFATRARAMTGPRPPASGGARTEGIPCSRRERNAGRAGQTSRSGNRGRLRRRSRSSRECTCGAGARVILCSRAEAQERSSGRTSVRSGRSCRGNTL
jgi:hypothetical protein